MGGAARTYAAETHASIALSYILYADDHEDMRLMVRALLASAGHEVSLVADGRAALDALQEREPDLLLLDVMMPLLSGLEACRAVKSNRFTARIPILMLSARSEEIDRVVGFEVGADDYVVKPFSPRELLARMRAVLRRARPERGSEKTEVTRLAVGPLEIDVPAHRVTMAGKDVGLTSFEFRVLVVLARRAGETVPREELAAAVKGEEPKKAPGEYDPSVDRSLDVHVSHLRQKIGDDAREPKRIRTVRGVGYCLVKPS